VNLVVTPEIGNPRHVDEDRLRFFQYRPFAIET
jgi:hypothetical protein